MEIAPLMKSIETICLILLKPKPKSDLTGFLISTYEEGKKAAHIIIVFTVHCTVANAVRTVPRSISFHCCDKTTVQQHAMCPRSIYRFYIQSHNWVCLWSQFQIFMARARTRDTREYSIRSSDHSKYQKMKFKFQLCRKICSHLNSAQEK